MSRTANLIRRPQIARRRPALTDGIVHPVTVRYASATPLTDRLEGRQPALQILTVEDVATLVDATPTNVFCIECGDNHAVGFCPDCGACDYAAACWKCGPQNAA